MVAFYWQVAKRKPEKVRGNLKRPAGAAGVQTAQTGIREIEINNNHLLLYVYDNSVEYPDLLSSSVLGSALI